MRQNGHVSATPEGPEPHGHFQVRVEPQGATVVLAVTGDIDILTAPKLDEAAQQALEDSPRALVLDLTGVTFLASAGLSVLVHTQNQCGDHTDMRIVAADTVTLRPLQLMALDQELAIYSSLDDALAAPLDR